MGGSPLLLLLLLEFSGRVEPLASPVPAAGTVVDLWDMDLLLLGGREEVKRVGRLLVLPS